MQRASTFLAAGALVVFAPLGRAADAPVYPLDEIVVTAARTRQPINQTLLSTTVITAQDIANGGQSTLLGVLQRLGGVEIGANGGAGQPSGVFIRGASSAQTLVLVDGMRQGSATTGSTAFENIPLDQIERIEIVAGPLSGLYGADAIGGVVQIFTKAGSGAPGYAVSAGYGTYDTGKASGSVNVSTSEYDVALAAGYENSDQFSATRPTIPFGQYNPDTDPYRNVNASGRVAYRFGEGGELAISGYVSEGRTHFDAGPETDDVNTQRLAGYAASLQSRFAPGWQSLLRVGRTTDDIVTTGQLPSHYRTDQDQATWQNTFDMPGGTLIAGGEYLRQAVSSDVAYTTTSRTIGSGFAGYTGDFGPHGVQGMIRYDDNSQFGAHTTGSAGYGYRFGDALRLRATAGTAFQAPTFNDLYYPDFGNPDLKAARSRSFDAGVDWHGGSQALSVTYFQNRILDLIVFDLTTFRPENLATAFIRGGEFRYEGTVVDATVRAKLTLQDPINEENGALLPRRARSFGSVDAARAWNDWRFGAELVASGARYDSADEDPTTRMGGYAVVNLYMAYAFAPGWTAELRWNNIGDKDYELAKGYNTPGGNVFVWLRWSPPPKAAR